MAQQLENSSGQLWMEPISYPFRDRQGSENSNRVAEKIASKETILRAALS